MKMTNLHRRRLCLLLILLKSRHVSDHAVDIVTYDTK